MPEGESTSEGEIAYCHACGSAMDVSAVGPFTNVACPSCQKHTRVKRELGPYTLLRRHAVGGMSMVFVAQDNTLDREVVVKILSEEYSADEKRIGAFEEEARITASISHPHVVRVMTTGRAFGRFYIAMEFVPGGHYEHHIHQRGSIPEAEVLPLMIQVAEGLSAAHECGLIHRDVKPGNILLDANGQAKIVDFGLALVTKGGKAQATEIWATPYYVPPETIEGLPEDFRSDLYAFGASFYHALAGKPPCDEESMDTRRLRDAKQHIEPLESAAPWVSPATCAVIDRCMAYAPEQRYGSYADLLASLRQARQHLAAGPPPPDQTTRPPAGRKGRRRGGGAGEKLALAGAGLAVVAAIVVALALLRKEPDPVVAPEPVQAGPVRADPVPVDDGGGALRVAGTYRRAGEALVAGDYEAARRLFGEVRDDAETLEPTATWAACEAAIVAHLAGKPGEARQEFGRALEHLRASDGLPAGVRRSLEPTLEQALGLPLIPGPGSPEARGAELLGWLIAGLKNWEQGGLAAAEPFLKGVTAAAPEGGQAWVAPYRRIAGDYLADLERLRAAEPEDFSLPPAECRALIDQLDALHGALKTRGRARFNVRCWQLELEKQARREPAPVPPEADAGAPDVPGLFAQCRFAEAIAALKAWEPEDAGAEAKRASLVALAEAASLFLDGMGRRLDGLAGDAVLETRDGRSFSAVVEGRPDGVTVRDAAGDERFLAWSEVSPESLISLHRKLRGNAGSELELLRRDEQAVAFDLLAGDADRARDAATRLAETSAPFARRWERLIAGFDS